LLVTNIVYFFFESLFSEWKLLEKYQFFKLFNIKFQGVAGPLLSDLLLLFCGLTFGMGMMLKVLSFGMH